MTAGYRPQTVFYKPTHRNRCCYKNLSLNPLKHTHTFCKWLRSLCLCKKSICQRTVFRLFRHIRLHEDNYIRKDDDSFEGIVVNLKIILMIVYHGKYAFFVG